MDSGGPWKTPSVAGGSVPPCVPRHQARPPTRAARPRLATGPVLADDGPIADHAVRSVHHRPGTPTMTLQTLGDALDEEMRDRADSVESAARVLEVTADELLAWLGDERLPGPSASPSVCRYLGIDERRYRGLSLRSQMRHVQTVIRYGPVGSARAS